MLKNPDNRKMSNRVRIEKRGGAAQKYPFLNLTN